MASAPRYFTPHADVTGARARGCFTCAHFHGEFFSGHVVCRQRPSLNVISAPLLGCAYWQREPGADDEWAGSCVQL